MCVYVCWKRGGGSISDFGNKIIVVAFRPIAFVIATVPLILHLFLLLYLKLHALDLIF